MTSFDIQSLFTNNIPLDETIDMYVDMVYSKHKKVKGMLKCHFRFSFNPDITVDMLMMFS